MIPQHLNGLLIEIFGKHPGGMISITTTDVGVFDDLILASAKWVRSCIPGILDTYPGYSVYTVSTPWTAYSSSKSHNDSRKRRETCAHCAILCIPCKTLEPLGHKPPSTLAIMAKNPV